MQQSLFILTFTVLLAGNAAADDQAATHDPQPAQTARTYVVNNRASNAFDDNPGTQIRPLRTIQAAADRARPSDTVLVRTGIYREEVVPPRGGDSPDRPITYLAAPGEEVSIRGSERITDWQDQGDGVWMIELDTAFFDGYNPFAMPVAGKWLFRGRDRRLGDVYCNGEASLQKIKLDQMKATPNTWYTDLKYGYANKFDFPADRQYPNNKIRIWANFADVNPNTALTEINYRNEWFGTNQAAIKILFPIDVVIRDNLLIAAPGVKNGTKGIWLDWGSQNTRVTGNVIHDFGSNLGLFLEVNFGPVIVDNNVIAPLR